MTESKYNSLLPDSVELMEDLLPIIPQYYENTIKEQQNLINACEKNNEIEIKRIIHKVRGSAISYGFPFIDELMSNLGIAVDKQDLEEMKDIVECFGKYLKKINVALASK